MEERGLEDEDAVDGLDGDAEGEAEDDEDDTDIAFAEVGSDVVIDEDCSLSCEALAVLVAVCSNDNPTDSR